MLLLQSKQGALQRALSSARQSSAVGPSRSSTEENEAPLTNEADAGEEATTPKQQSLAALKVHETWIGLWQPSQR